MYLLDTNICIFIIKKKNAKVLDNLKKNRNKGLYISGITLAELEFGIENADPHYNIKNRVALMEFLSIFEIKNFDENAAKEYGKIKKDLKDRKYLIGPFDMLIGAHAKSLKMILVTNNTDEFNRIKNLKIEDWTLMK
ncbi:MAG: type II toxin-antitoxin system VapC family toxin [Treponema sp.]|nr:type II toxin-antitoxin system VapC family toxin [Treponema sp.]MCL2251070.1 type II toxin-antitoxin system VapC family toxin [Treponema sp.]MCL2251661.1 type II toxin-antitoxin system VapC family toxin [Treponema sp.]